MQTLFLVSKRATRMVFFIIFSILGLFSNPIFAGVITVGVGPNCTVATPQAAINRARNFGGFNVIWITRAVADNAYYRQNIKINPRTDLDRLQLQLIGGFDDCEDSSPSGHTLLSGYGEEANDAKEPVIEFDGVGDLFLENIIIGDGDQTDQNDEGGGIDFQGQGELRLVRTEVVGNTTYGNGAGIRLIAQAGPATLFLQSDVAIYSNRAILGSEPIGGGGIYVQGSGSNFSNVIIGDRVLIYENRAENSRSGGGLDIRGNAALSMVGNNNTILRNYAAFNGGGVHLGAGTTANIGASNFSNTLLTFQENLADLNGGGIYLSSCTASGSSDTVLHLFSVDGNNPIHFNTNKALRGGAIFVTADCTSGAGVAKACLRSVRVDGNRTVSANLDSAILQANGSNAEINFNEDAGCDFPPEANLSCNYSACNTISSSNYEGAPTAARSAVIASTSGAKIKINRIILNQQVSAFRAVVQALTGGRVEMRNSVVSSILDSAQGLGTFTVFENGSSLRVEDTTVLDLGSASPSAVPVINQGAGTAFIALGVLFDTPSQPLVFFDPGSPPALNYVLVAPNQVPPDFPSAFWQIIAGTPQYLNDCRQPSFLFLCRQAPNSPGLDIAPNRGGVDFLGQIRDVNFPNVGGLQSRDIGAFETQLSDVPLNFANGFE